jgi:hypothetical protein
MPGTSVALTNEWSLLLLACSSIPRQEKSDRIRLLLEKPTRWPSLFDLADRHGAQPFLCQALAGVHDAVPADQMSSIMRSYEINLHRALLLSRELIRIVERLSALGIEVLPYKGPALAELVYTDIALRQSGDIDLLIHPQDFTRVRDAVRELGYTPHVPLTAAQERASLRSGYEAAFDGSAGPNLLEVQWAVQPRFYAIDFAMAGLFQRAVNVSIGGHAMKTPSAEDLFLVLSTHAAKHVWGRLVWLCDIARIMSLPALNWGWIGSQAEVLGIVRIARVTMLLANRMLAATIPSAAHASLPEDAAAPALAEDLQPEIASESLYNVESVPYFRLMMSLRERASDRRRFLRRLVFTPGPGEWQAVRLPGSLFPLYHLVRLSRLAARFIRG